MSSEKRFGYEWHKYHQMDSDYEIQFLKWISPFGPEIFEDKTVLDAGCGMGRNSFWALKYGAKKLFGFDFDERSVKAAQKNLSAFDNCHVEFKSIYYISWQSEFDIVFCIGVVHHLEDSHRAVENLIRALKPGGLILIWVYGYEGNEWIVRWVNPVREHITSKLPLPVLHLLTYFLSLPFWLFLKIFPQKSTYLKQLSLFSFYHLHSIIFDQLLPRTARYYKKEEAFRLLAEHDLKKVGISHCNQNSWTVYGYK